MRDPKRIRAFCDRLAKAWKKVPDLRFGQLMTLIKRDIEEHGNLFFSMEDLSMILCIEHCIEQMDYVGGGKTVLSKEQILNALNRCEPYAAPDCCNGCPYQRYGDSIEECITQLHADAHALLKPKEPRVMTADEVRNTKGYAVVWFEYGPKDELGGRIYASCLERVTMYSFVDAETGNGVVTEVACFLGEGMDYMNEYGKMWRLWTERPSEELADATPW